MLRNNPAMLALQSRIASLKVAKDQATERKNVITTRIDSQNQRIKELEIKLKKKQLERDELQSEINELNNEKAEKEQDYQKKLSQKNEIQQRLSQNESKLSSIKNEVNAKKQERQRIAKRLEDLNEIVKHPVTPKIIYYHSPGCSGNRYQHCWQHPYDPTGIENVAEYQIYQSALTERSSLIQLQNKVIAEHQTLESKSYYAEKAVEDERDNLKRHESTMNYSREQINKLQDKIQTTQQKSQSLSEECNSLENDVADVNSLLKDSRTEKNDVESKIDNIQNTIAQLELELQKIKIELNKRISQEQEEEVRSQRIEEQAREELIDEEARNQLIEEQARQQLREEGFLDDVVTTATDVWPNAVSGLLANAIFNNPQMRKLEKELGGNPKDHTGNFLLDNVKPFNK